MSLVYGPESAGKTTLLMKACSTIVDHCHVCKEHFVDCGCGENFEPGRALWIETEGTFDTMWAVAQGLDPDVHTILRPRVGEEAIDIAYTAILEDIYDLIILDSIAATVPANETEKSASDSMVADQARMMNRAIRRWNQGMLVMRKRAPAVMLVNQMREKAGVVFGDPRTLPGGKAQNYFPSQRVCLKKAAIKDAPDNPQAYAEISGVVDKNKTYPPRQAFSFHLALRDYSLYRQGSVNDAETLVKYGRQAGLITAGGKAGWQFELPVSGTVTAANKKELVELLDSETDIFHEFYSIILQAKLVA
jgi:recombination protein RecA